MTRKERSGFLLMTLIGGIIGGAVFNFFLTQVSSNGVAQAIKVTPRPAPGTATSKPADNSLSVYNKNDHLIFRVGEANNGSGAQMTFYDNAGVQRVLLQPFGSNGDMRLMLLNKKQGTFALLGADMNKYGDPTPKSLLRLYNIETGEAFWTSPTK